MAVDLTVPIPAAADWFVGMIDQAKIQAWISDYLEALRQAAEPGTQRVQMVQTSSQSITATTWTTLTSMSYAAGNGGFQGVTGMGAISSGLLTMPTGSAGQWAASAQVSVQNATGLTTVRAAVLQNSNRVITSGEPGTDTGGFQGPSIPEFEFAVADGDKIGLQVYLVGANSTTSTMAANSSVSFLRLKKLP